MTPIGHDRTSIGAFAIGVREEPGTITISVAGDLDIDTAPRLKATIDGLVDRDADLRLDVRDLEFLDSSGLNVLLGASYACQQGGRTFRLVEVTDLVRRVLDITGVTGHLT